MWVWLENSLMNDRSEWIFCWNTLSNCWNKFFYKHQANLVQPRLCLIWNLIFSKSTQPPPMILCLRFYLEQAFFFWYIRILLKSFSFWDIENVKSKSQPRYAYKLYGYYFFSNWVFFYEHLRNYHLHPLHRHLDISRAITAETLPLHIASSWTWNGNLWLLSANR